MSSVYPDSNICIIVIAYNAEKTIKNLISEIPKKYVDEIIVGDDASTDNTYQILQSIKGINVIKNVNNKKMGGNLKILFNQAISNNADIIIQLHGDNQYDASKIPDMLDEIINNDMDMVLGSRILGGKTLIGGMPRYKYFGNHLLNFIQNVAYDMNLSDYATGYKAYRVNSLKKIPYNENRNDFVFDEQINTQFIYFGYKVSQIGIPTRYFDEASSVGLLASIHYGCWTIVVVLHLLFIKLSIYTPRYLRMQE